ncbi:gastrin/cholecystokinin type B receptor-like [Penaeus chinensis]|uniref:gastrin/cholecystokinin type B receptor-like n=1 Tax=Penaeus chinensis TaxID=139456 RepID=UPI001FB61B7F|nr:gastrin/cholecystokinin type B receptor-like [Penaeus chinensis]
MAPLINPEDAVGVLGTNHAPPSPNTTFDLNSLTQEDNLEGPSTDDYDYDPDVSLSIFFWDELLPPLIVFTLTLLLGILGNSLIIYTICRYSRMKSTTNVFLASLASADLLLILICVPVKTAKVFAYSWTFGWFLCKGIHYLQNVSAICSVLTLTAMSMERYYAILFPFQSKYILTIRQAKRMTGLVWFLSVILSVPILFAQVHTQVGERVVSYWCHRDWDNVFLWRTYELYMLLVVLVIPTLVMGFAYTAIGYKLTKVMIERSSLVGSGHLVSSRSRDDDRDVRQIVTMLIVVVVLFIICWAPLLITNVIKSWRLMPLFEPHSFYKHLLNAVHLLAYFNSCINPIVYGFLSKNFRESFYAALCPCLRPVRPPLRQMSLSHTRTTSVGYKESIRLSVRHANRATNV